MQMKLHASDGGFALVLVQTLVKVLPPLEQHAVADELEPWSEGQGVVLEHGL